MGFFRSCLPLFLVLAALSTRASSIVPLTLDQQVHGADAVFRGTVLQVVSFRGDQDGLIYTRTLLRVDEAFKGTFPAVVQVLHRGGSVGGIGLIDGSAPQFRVGEERLIFVSRRADRTLFATQGSVSAIELQRNGQSQLTAGNQNLLDQVRKVAAADGPGADVTDQSSAAPSKAASANQPPATRLQVTSNGLLQDAGGTAGRFLTTDRGEVHPYLVDADALPTGITLSNALNAVSNAFAAWSAVCPIRFYFAGTQSFGTAAGNISSNDGIFRIQLHDNYGYIPEPSVLGKGGRYTTAELLSVSGWGAGGNVGGLEFHESLCGFVVLKHTSASLQNPLTLAEVLCHEVGHAIGLAHSSENPSEPDTTLKQAVMYYAVHADGRGATLGSYDPPIVRQLHPTNNTPPYTYDRVIDVSTDTPAPNIPGINDVLVRGYDLETTNLTFAVALADQDTNSGAFSAVGQTIKFAPFATFNAPRITDLESGSYYDIIYARYSDGTDSSGYATIRTVSLNPDQFPSAADGLPNNWMTNYFGHADPQAGDESRATDDADDDGLNNFQEYRAGMEPKNSNSTQRITFISPTMLQWQAKGYELYELQGSTNLSTWVRVGNPIVPKTSTGTVANFCDAAAPHRFFRIWKVP